MNVRCSARLKSGVGSTFKCNVSAPALENGCGKLFQVRGLQNISVVNCNIRYRFCSGAEGTAIAIVPQQEHLHL